MKNKILSLFLKIEQYCFYVFFILLLIFFNPLFITQFTAHQIVNYLWVIYVFICLFSIPTLTCAILKIGRFDFLNKKN